MNQRQKKVTLHVKFVPKKDSDRHLANKDGIKPYTSAFQPTLHINEIDTVISAVDWLADDQRLCVRNGNDYH